MSQELVLCYNRGCGAKYNENENTATSCTFHPGVPVFHDAYKGWSCCKKKCTDFTEFLNIKGCTVSFHSNEKPPEPEKPVIEEIEVVPVRQPIVARLERPPLDTALTKMKPQLAPSLSSQMQSMGLKKETIRAETETAIGTVCKRGGCKKEYTGVDTDDECVHHPGVPVFHEGLKFWSCCTKRTTDFAAFLEQVGCTVGQHLWKEEPGSNTKPVCRHDWHQTGSHVIISIFAKKYDPFESSVYLNPIRAKIELIFPENDEKFNMDVELRGVIDVSKSEVTMLGTKVEIKLKKAEPGSWSDLSVKKQAPVPKLAPKPKAEQFDDDPVDLSDIQ